MRNLSKNEINNRLAKYGVLLLEDYTKANIKTKMRCRCGKEFYCRPGCIFRGSTKSCGCYNKEATSKRCLINLVGQKFNRLEVKELLPLPKKHRKYKCICNCGTIKIISANHLRNGHAQSCGCLNKELARSRNGINSPHYKLELTDEDRIERRFLLENKIWRNSVFEKDNYICQICYYKGAGLNAHHLDGYNWCKERRFDKTNGITLCKKCHKNFHKIYGRGNNTEQQFLEYKRLNIW